MPDPKRLDPRHPAGHVPAKLRFNHPLRLLDLSSGGARVETTEWLAPGRRYALRIGSDPELQLDGEIVRCALVRIDGAAGSVVYEAGVRFGPLSEATRTQLDRLLATLPAPGSAGAEEAIALHLAVGY